MPRTCFVIMPFSKTSSCIGKQWTNIFYKVLKPAVEGAGLDYECRRSSATRGNLIKKIILDLNDSHVVIADLTDQNANVFYELGVRHSLGNRTILLAQKPSDIPFDLKVYAYHVYAWKTKKAKDDLAVKLRELLSEIDSNPDRADNPVSDFLGDRSLTDDIENSAPLSYAQRRETLDRLGELFANGVKYRNGEIVPTDTELKTWEAACEYLIRPLSISHLHEFRTLDLFRPRVSGPKRVEVIDGKLQVLRQVIRDHDPDIQYQAALRSSQIEAQILVNVSGPPKARMEQLDIVGMVTHGTSNRWVVSVPYEIRATRATHVDKLQLVVGKEHFDEIRSFNGPLSKVAVSGEAVFHLPIDLPNVPYQVMLVALSEKKEWGSSEFSLTLGN